MDDLPDAAQSDQWGGTAFGQGPFRDSTTGGTYDGGGSGKGCGPLNRAEPHHSRLLLPTQTTVGTQPAMSLPLIVTAPATATIVHPVGIRLGEGNICQQAG